LRELLDSTLMLSYGEGDLIVQEGSYFSGIYIVYRGLVQIGKYSSTGKRRVLRFLAPREMFGLEALFMREQEMNIQYARALVDSDVLFIKERGFCDFLKSHPAALFTLCQWFAREVAMLEFKLTRDATEGSLQNFALLLAALKDKYGSRTASGIQIKLELPRQLLAELLGVSVETIIRLMKNLKDRGIITAENSEITITDEDKLTSIGRTTAFYLEILKETL
jgi:CRP/FNR family transcriptional regulator